MNIDKLIGQLDACVRIWRRAVGDATDPGGDPCDKDRQLLNATARLHSYEHALSLVKDVAGFIDRKAATIAKMMKDGKGFLADGGAEHQHVTDEWCSCGHLKSYHADRFGGISKGHGGCTESDCDCEQFTFAGFITNGAEAKDASTPTGLIEYVYEDDTVQHLRKVARWHLGAGSWIASAPKERLLQALTGCDTVEVHLAVISDKRDRPRTGKRS